MPIGESMLTARSSLLSALWERSACEVLEEPRLTLGVDDVFASIKNAGENALLDMRDRAQVGPSRVLRGYVCNGSVMNDVSGDLAALSELLPQEADCDFDAWSSRLKSGFLVHVPFLHRYCAAIRIAVDQFICAVVGRVGLPTEGFWVDCYAGRYRQTPFGIHLDGASNFAFGVVGKKTMRLWSPESFWSVFRHEGNPQLSRSGARRDRELLAAVSIDIEPGRLSYWPSWCWHVAEPDDAFCVHVNISGYWRKERVLQAEGVYSESQLDRLEYSRLRHDPIVLAHAFRNDFTDEERVAVCRVLEPFVNAAVSRVAPRIDRSPRTNVDVEGKGGLLPRDVIVCIEAIKGEQERDLRERVERWLCVLSSKGLGPVLREPEDIRVGQVVRVISPLWWYEWRGGRLLVGANGMILNVSSEGSLVAFMEQLNQRGAMAVGEVLGIFSGRVEVDGFACQDALGMLSLFYVAGAIDLWSQ